MSGTVKGGHEAGLAPAVGRLGAHLVTLHRRDDSQRFLAPGSPTASISRSTSAASGLHGSQPLISRRRAGTRPALPVAGPTQQCVLPCRADVVPREELNGKPIAIEGMRSGEVIVFVEVRCDKRERLTKMPV